MAPNSNLFNPREYKIISLRECPTPSEIINCDNPERVAEYFNLNIKTHPYFNPEVECFFVLYLNAHKKLKGHSLISTGTMDTILVHPREVFRLAVIASSAAIILVHNHPSGDPSPSEADIKVTRDLIRAGQILKIEVCDHIIMGTKSIQCEKEYCSLRELGYFNF